MIAPRYPIYIISKGRADRPLTAKALERIGIPYYIAVEPQEEMSYRSAVKGEVLVTPFSNLGQGSIPVRNFCWSHASSLGVERFYTMDDNIDGWYRLFHNLKIPVITGSIFRAMESFCDRYENIALAGPHYFMFASRKCKQPPFNLNRRVYSCILIKTDLPYRWRGRYNEDTDLSLRALKDGWCTVLFSAFLAMKQTTMTMKGGNSDELYQGDGRLKMAQSLVEQHPDVASITRKWGRWQHQVDYSQFKRNRLKLKPGIVIPDGPNEFGMKLQMDPGAVLPW
jgi:hypothetical protein